jgi:hypothetical protein
MKIAYFGGVTGGNSGSGVDPKILERYTYFDAPALSVDLADKLTVSVATTVSEIPA